MLSIRTSCATAESRGSGHADRLRSDPFRDSHRMDFQPERSTSTPRRNVAMECNPAQRSLPGPCSEVLSGQRDQQWPAAAMLPSRPIRSGAGQSPHRPWWGGDWRDLKNSMSQVRPELPVRDSERHGSGLSPKAFFSGMAKLTRDAPGGTSAEPLSIRLTPDRRTARPQERQPHLRRSPAFPG
jgi:hypothetical protein